MEYLIVIFFIVLFSFIQSIMGIGLLMFGTPTLLLLGYSFVETLNILLIPSILISTLQIIGFQEKNEKNIITFKQRFIFLCLPFLLLGLIIMKLYYDSINFQLFIGIIIFISAMIRIFKIGLIFVHKNINSTSSIFHILIGIIHGITNMGGSFLSMFASSIYSEDKYKARYIVGYAYLIMGVIQLIYINLFFSLKFDLIIIFYSALSLTTYILLGNRVFKVMRNEFFNNFINYIIAFYGFILIIKNL